jgi:hypothetical protein
MESSEGGCNPGVGFIVSDMDLEEISGLKQGLS